MMHSLNAAARASMFFFFSSRRRHTRLQGDWSSDVCSSDLNYAGATYADLKSEYVIHDALGNVQAFTSRAGQTMAFTYYPSGQVAQKTYADRSEERRVGKECRSRWSPYH